MQLLTFTVDAQTYAIESRRVIEVLPAVPGRPIPRAPSYVRGVFTYRGRIIPLVDLGRRIADVTLRERLSTRVVVVSCDSPASGAATSYRLGIIAEDVLLVRSTGDSDVAVPSLPVPGAPYLGRLLRIEDRTVQLVVVEHLLPAAMVAGLTDPGMIPTGDVGEAAAPAAVSPPPTLAPPR